MRLVQNISHSVNRGVADMLEAIAVEISSDIGTPYNDIDTIDWALRTGKSPVIYQKAHDLSHAMPIACAYSVGRLATVRPVFDGRSMRPPSPVFFPLPLADRAMVIDPLGARCTDPSRRCMVGRQISSSSSSSKEGLGRCIYARSSLLLLIPNISPTCSSSAPRWYIRWISVSRADCVLKFVISA